MFFDFRKAFILFAILKIFLNENINIINIPGVPLLTLELAMNLCFAIFYFTIRDPKKKNDKFPFSIPFLLVIISIAISTIFSTAGFYSALTRSIGTILNDIVFTYILWKVLKSGDDLRLLFGGLLLVFIFIALYGIFEKITGQNPIYDYEISLSGSAGKSIDFTLPSKERLGMSWVRSVIIHPIGLGVYIGGFLSMFLFINKKYPEILGLPKGFILLVSFLLLCVLFFCNSRSPLVFFAVSIIPLISFRNRLSPGMIIGIMILCFLGFRFIEPYFGNILSIFNNNGTTDDVGGSSLSQRLMQYASAIYLTKGHFISGLGIKSLDNLFGTDSGILGAESIWLALLVERGFIGIISHIILLIYVFRMGAGLSKMFIRCFTIAWALTTTITSTPGCGIYFFFMCIIIIKKAEILKMDKISAMPLPNIEK